MRLFGVIILAVIITLPVVAYQVEIGPGRPVEDGEIERQLQDHSERIESLESRVEDEDWSSNLFALVTLFVGAGIAFFFTRIGRRMELSEQERELRLVLSSELRDNYLALVKITPKKDREDIGFWLSAGVVAKQALDNVSTEVFSLSQDRLGKLGFSEMMIVRKAYAKIGILLRAAEHAMPTIERAIKNDGKSNGDPKYDGLLRPPNKTSGRRST